LDRAGHGAVSGKRLVGRPSVGRQSTSFAALRVRSKGRVSARAKREVITSRARLRKCIIGPPWLSILVRRILGGWDRSRGRHGMPGQTDPSRRSFIHPSRCNSPCWPCSSVSCVRFSVNRSRRAQSRAVAGDSISQGTPTPGSATVRTPVVRPHRR
jgi:hypothetical protein